jgi:hypothetical protein
MAFAARLPSERIPLRHYVMKSSFSAYQRLAVGSGIDCATGKTGRKLKASTTRSR